MATTHAAQRESRQLRSEEDMVKARQIVREHAKQLGFSLVDQTKLVTATSELARNALIHGGGGTVELERIEKGARCGLQLTFKDRGPGIENVELALRDGYTTGHGLGLGLSGSKRLVHEFAIRSRVGEGTTVIIAMWK